MIKKAFPDIFIAGLFLALAFFVAAYLAPAKPKPLAGLKKPGVESNSRLKTTWSPPVSLETALKKRNLFSEDGSYALSAEKTKKVKEVLPENPYTLVAVLLGKEQKAVFRDYKGAIHTLTKGKKLIDGAVLTGISARSVKIKKDDTSKELVLFDVRRKSAEPARPKADRRKLEGTPARGDALQKARGTEIKKPQAPPAGNKAIMKTGTGPEKGKEPHRRDMPPKAPGIQVQMEP
ncbi:hypothetical protein SAMN04489760_1406 [Syntrophus gentianae]|uniref:Type II secretion system protein GspC N-terminal domain-containing protein n=1 Tax=Syntrophus gentianae TaxID=43775 RepID=A0A1H8AVD3_9BACT|nr:hypothetical protein [Syntrophus gentianae]SEM73467.1 hypothetical protein SAMN04489760_1406 [Syntrophus gentianae]